MRMPRIYFVASNYIDCQCAYKEANAQAFMLHLLENRYTRKFWKH